MCAVHREPRPLWCWGRRPAGVGGGPACRLRVHLPDHLVLLDQRQELRPPGVTQLLTLNVEIHGSRRGVF